MADIGIHSDEPYCQYTKLSMYLVYKSKYGS